MYTYKLQIYFIKQKLGFQGRSIEYYDLNDELWLVFYLNLHIVDGYVARAEVFYLRPDGAEILDMTILY